MRTKVIEYATSGFEQTVYISTTSRYYRGLKRGSCVTLHRDWWDKDGYYRGWEITLIKDLQGNVMRVVADLDTPTAVLRWRSYRADGWTAY